MTASQGERQLIGFKTGFDDLTEGSFRETDAGVGSAVINFQHVVIIQQGVAGKDHIADSSALFIIRFGEEDRIFAPGDLFPRFFVIEDGGKEHIYRAVAAGIDAVIDLKPSLFDADRRRTCTQFLIVPVAGTGFEGLPVFSQNSRSFEKDIHI